MKKEILVVIIIGLSLGLIITYGVYRMRSALTQAPSSTTIENSSLPDEAQVAAVLNIVHPPDGSVVQEKSLTVTGTSVPDSYVVLFVNNQEFISTTDGTGSFSFDVQLTEGSNVLTTHIVDQEGVTTTDERVVIVQTPVVQASASATPAPRR